jgi:hypothetical protein
MRRYLIPLCGALFSFWLVSVQPFSPTYSFVKVFDGQPARWPSCSVIPYEVKGDPSGSAPIINATFTWLGRETNLHFEAVDGENAPVVVLFVERLPNDENGVTFTSYRGRWLERAEVEIVNNNELRGAFERDVIEHELAHVVGLGDVSRPGEMMTENLNYGAALVHWSAGDMAGLARLRGHC